MNCVKPLSLCTELPILRGTGNQEAVACARKTREQKKLQSILTTGCAERDQSACEKPEEKCFALENPCWEEVVAQEPEKGSLDSLVNPEELAAPQKAQPEKEIKHDQFVDLLSEEFLEEEEETQQFQEEMRRQVEEEAEKLCEQKEKSLRTLKEDLGKASEEEELCVRKEGAERLSKLRAKISSETKAEEERIRAEQEIALQKLREEWESRQVTEKESLERKLQLVLEKMKLEMEEAQQKEMTELEQGKERFLSEFKERLDGEKKKAVEELEKQFAAELQQLKSAAEEKHRKLSELMREKRQEVEKDHERKMERMKEEHHEVLARIRDQYEEEVLQGIKQERKQRAELLEGLRGEMARLRQLHEAEAKALQAGLDGQLAVLQQRHREEVPGAMARTGDQLILAEDPDHDYVPNEQEIQFFAREIGIDPEKEPELMWLAKEGILAPLPPNWIPCQNTDGDIYFFNFATGVSMWDHPSDDHYRELVIQERQKLLAQDNLRKKKKDKKKDTASGTQLPPIRAPVGKLPPLRGLAAPPHSVLSGFGLLNLDVGSSVDSSLMAKGGAQSRQLKEGSSSLMNGTPEEPLIQLGPLEQPVDALRALGSALMSFSRITAQEVGVEEKEQNKAGIEEEQSKRTKAAESERDQSACEKPEEKCFALENPCWEEVVAQEPEKGSLDSLVNPEEHAAPQKEGLGKASEEEELCVRKEGAERLSKLRAKISSETKAEEERIRAEQEIALQKLREEWESRQVTEKESLERKLQLVLEKMKLEMEEAQQKEMTELEQGKERFLSEFKERLDGEKKEAVEELEKQFAAELQQLKSAAEEKHRKIISSLQAQLAEAQRSEEAHLHEDLQRAEQKVQQRAYQVREHERELSELMRQKRQEVEKVADEESLRKKRQQLLDEDRRTELERDEAAVAAQLCLEERRKEQASLFDAAARWSQSLEELQDQKAELEAQVDLLQMRSQRLQKRVSELEAAVSSKLEAEESVEPPRRKAELRVEDLRETVQAHSSGEPASPPSHSPEDSDFPFDHVRSCISEEQISIRNAKEFLVHQIHSMKKRHTVLKAAKQQWRQDMQKAQEVVQDPDSSQLLEAVHKNLEEEAKQLDKMKSAMRKGQVLLKEKKEKLSQLESLLLEELSGEDTLKSAAGKKMVTFDLSSSEDTDSENLCQPKFDLRTELRPAPQLDEIQHLKDSLQRISSELNRVLGILGPLDSRPSPLLTSTPCRGVPPSPYMPAAGLGAGAARVPPAGVSLPDTWPWSAELSSGRSFTAVQSLESFLAEKRRKYFPGGFPSLSGSSKPLDNKLGYVSAQEQLRLFQHSQFHSHEKMSIERKIETHKKWLEDFKRNSQVYPFPGSGL
ncbi:uncharacterized protein O3Q21_010514 [Podargus strigoides]